MMNWWRYVVFALAFTHIAVCAADPCVYNMDIGYPYRSTEFLAKEDFICDLHVIAAGNWYRFKQYTGGKIPEHCPYYGYCGTQVPVWMNGSHPTDMGVVKTVQACTNYGTCCDKSEDMDVMLCDVDGEQFYVYKLPPVTSCPTAYCAGDKMPCEKFAEIWDDEKEMCVNRPTTTTTTSTKTSLIPSTTTTSSAIVKTSTKAPQTTKWSETTLAASTKQPSPSTPFPSDDSKIKKITVGFVIGLCTGCILFGALVTALIFVYIRKREAYPKVGTETSQKHNVAEVCDVYENPPAYDYIDHTEV